MSRRNKLNSTVFDKYFDNTEYVSDLFDNESLLIGGSGPGTEPRRQPPLNLQGLSDLDDSSDTSSPSLTRSVSSVQDTQESSEEVVSSEEGEALEAIKPLRFEDFYVTQKKVGVISQKEGERALDREYEGKILNKELDKQRAKTDSLSGKKRVFTPSN